MSEELKPCPFCGGEAKLVTGTSSMVECQNDQCIIGDPAPFNDFSHRADAVAAWNTRATPSQGLDAATVEQAAISLIVDLCGAGASQSSTNVRVVEDHLRQFARALAIEPHQHGGEGA